MPDEPSTDDAPAKGDADTTNDQSADLGDAGKKALDAERAARREAERKLKEYEDQNKSELERLQDAVKERDTQLAELPSQVRQQAIRFASFATQAGFLDPEDALVFIDADLGDGDAVKAALAELAERKPHLVRRDKTSVPTRPKPATGTNPEPAGTGVSGKERAAAALRQMRN
jgi:peptidoglycan hydrolase CwlO-like protein